MKDMRLAIMQPYLFPYIGYFQLIRAVDTFVILDDVNYINRGWINRNRILVNNKDHIFTVPLEGASQNKLINQTLIVKDFAWKGKFLKTIEMTYKKAPLFEKVLPLIESAIHDEERNVSTFILHSLTIIMQYLNIGTRIVESSSLYNNAHLKAQDKILDICLQEGASTYVNPIGGTELYDGHAFRKNNIDLFFIKSGQVEYRQFNDQFVPSLSVLDVLMFNSREDVSLLLDRYTLVEHG